MAVQLSSTIRANLVSLQSTTQLINQTSDRLATGLAVSSPIDDAVKYFQAKSLNDRAADLSGRKDGIDQGVSALKTAIGGIESLENMVKQMKGIVDSARSGTDQQRAEFTKQIGEVAKQIENLVEDTSYQGLNLINSTASSLSVYFSEKADSKLTINGSELNSSGLYRDGAASVAASTIGLTTIAATGAASTVGVALLVGLGFSAGGFTGYGGLTGTQSQFNAAADAAILSLDATINNLRATASSLGTNAAILSNRLDFTENYVSALEEGAGKLNLADLNDEGANLLALQTRQQLGIQSLSFAGQAERSILGLFG